MANSREWFTPQGLEARVVKLEGDVERLREALEEAVGAMIMVIEALKAGEGLYLSITETREKVRDN
ncbi:MAG TPA: hypothetical protein VEI97_10165 [bacterium]|nr:hypothetical protein [bacterium]